MFENLDFYEILKEDKRGGLDPSESRKENVRKLKKAFQLWMPRVNPEADVTKQLITEARIIFENENNYNGFREWRLRYKLIPFIEGASQDGKLTRKKAGEAKEKGRKEGYTDVEVEDLFEAMNVQVVAKIPSREKLINLPPALFKSIAVIFILLVLIPSFFFVYKFLLTNQSNSDDNIEQTNVQQQVIEAIDAVNKPAPLWGELKKAIPILLENKNNSLYKDRIRKGLLQAKQCCIKMGKESPNNNDALDWFELARKIDPHDSEVNNLISDAKERRAE